MSISSNWHRLRHTQPATNSTQPNNNSNNTSNNNDDNTQSETSKNVSNRININTRASEIIKSNVSPSSKRFKLTSSSAHPTGSTIHTTSPFKQIPVPPIKPIVNSTLTLQICLYVQYVKTSNDKLYLHCCIINYNELCIYMKYIACDDTIELVQHMINHDTVNSNNTTTLQQCKIDIEKICMSRVLIVHNSDITLQLLDSIHHPIHLLRDINRYHLYRNKSLAQLSTQYTDLPISSSSDAVELCKLCLSLYKRVSDDWERKQAVIEKKHLAVVKKRVEQKKKNAREKHQRIMQKSGTVQKPVRAAGTGKKYLKKKHLSHRSTSIG